MSRRYGSVRGAASYLRRLIGDAALSDSMRLPRIRRLAQDAGVAEGTMIRAVRVLRDDGLLTVSHGRGTWVAGRHTAIHQPRADAAQDRGPKWRRLRRRVFADVLTTFSRSSELPSAKLLCRRYGASPSTVGRALRSLCDEGVLSVHKRTYRVASVAGRRPDNRLIVVARGLGQGDVIKGEAAQHALLQDLERQCELHRLRLRLVPYYYVGVAARGLAELREEVRDCGDLVGSVMLTMGLDDAFVSDATALLQGTGRPLGILDESGSCAAADSPLVMVLRPQHEPECGSAVAQYLLGLGHRSLLYVDIAEDMPWSQARFLGLRQRCDLLRPAPALTRLVPMQPSAGLTGVGELTSMGACLIERQRVDGFSDGQWSLLASRRLNAAIVDLDAAATDLQLRASVFVTLDGAAAAVRRSTALVAANDTVALACLDWCARQHVAVPRQMSIVGFDDSADAASAGLTSFNFRPADSVAALVRFVTDRRRFVKLGGSAMDAGGSLTVRNTTARALTGR